jgi:hypothetical protein
MKGSGDCIGDRMTEICLRTEGTGLAAPNMIGRCPHPHWDEPFLSEGLGDTHYSGRQQEKRDRDGKVERRRIEA